ncbi:PucR family transcriptional regulator, partial [Bacillus licheniformis]|nr:PucR family transcriptional regulator [Bacillus licheniformis]
VSAVLKLPVLLFNQHLKPIASSKADAAGTLSDYEGIFQKGNRTGLTCFSTIPDKQTYSVFPIYTHEKKCGF